MINYRRLFLPLLCLPMIASGGGSLPANAQSSAPSAQVNSADTPAHLLETIRQLASQGDYASLEDYLYPLTIPNYGGGPYDVRQQMLEGIRSQKSGSDFAYSDAAIGVLIARYIDRFRPLKAAEAALLQQQYRLDDQRLQALAKQSPEAFVAFNEPLGSGCHPMILLVKLDQAYKLMYWYNLTCLSQ